MNLQGIVSQLISSRPPVALAGVPITSSSETLTVGCIPIAHQSVAVEFDWLSQIDSDCANEDTVMSSSCTSAISQFCNTLGWTTGLVFELTSRPWVSCFNSGLREQVDIAQLGVDDDLFSAETRLDISQWCISQGFGAGLIQTVFSNDMVEVHCFKPSVSVNWSYISDSDNFPEFDTSGSSVGISWNNLRKSNSYPLSECEGDCDEDKDCKLGLMCLQRGSGDETSIPGCSGRDVSRTDYCIKKDLVPWNYLLQLRLRRI